MKIEVVEPRLVVNSFNDEATQKYIDTLDNIMLTHSSEQPILVEIDSFGGSLYNLMRLIEKFNTVPNPIATFCSSKAMSAGLFLLSIVGSHGLRFASPMSQMMLHEIQAGGAFSDIKEIENVTENLKDTNKQLMDLFARRIGLKDAKDVRKLIRDNSTGNDLYLSAEKAKALHMIDEIRYCRILPQIRFELLVGDAASSKLDDIYERPEKKEKKGRKHE